MTEFNKWGIPGWGAAQGQIIAAVHFLCDGKPNREAIAEEIVSIVRAIARGREPGLQSDRWDEKERIREGWARGAARHIVDGALAASEREGAGPPPVPEQVSLLREIIKHALWHMPNSSAEARSLARYIDIENLRQPHPRDDAPGRD